MNASAFIANLETFGVRIARNGDELTIKTRPGASADGFIDLIRLNRTGLLATLAGEGHDIPWITPGDLTWVRVSQEEVAETEPPADWDGTLPADCAWSHLCTVLGPCPHAADGRCRCQSHRSLRAATESSEATEAAVA